MPDNENENNNPEKPDNYIEKALQRYTQPVLNQTYQFQPYSSAFLQGSNSYVLYMPFIKPPVVFNGCWYKTMMLHDHMSGKLKSFHIDDDQYAFYTTRHDYGVDGISTVNSNHYLIRKFQFVKIDIKGHLGKSAYTNDIKLIKRALLQHGPLVLNSFGRSLLHTNIINGITDNGDVFILEPNTSDNPFLSIKMSDMYEKMIIAQNNIHSSYQALINQKKNAASKNGVEGDKYHQFMITSLEHDYKISLSDVGIYRSPKNINEYQKIQRVYLGGKFFHGGQVKNIPQTITNSIKYSVNSHNNGKGAPFEFPSNNILKAVIQYIKACEKSADINTLSELMNKIIEKVKFCEKFHSSYKVSKKSDFFVHPKSLLTDKSRLPFGWRMETVVKNLMLDLKKFNLSNTKENLKALFLLGDKLRKRNKSSDKVKINYENIEQHYTSSHQGASTQNSIDQAIEITELDANIITFIYDLRTLLSKSPTQYHQRLKKQQKIQQLLFHLKSKYSLNEGDLSKIQKVIHRQLTEDQKRLKIKEIIEKRQKQIKEEYERFIKGYEQLTDTFKVNRNRFEAIQNQWNKNNQKDKRIFEAPIYINPKEGLNKAYIDQFEKMVEEFPLRNPKEVFPSYKEAEDENLKNSSGFYFRILRKKKSLKKSNQVKHIKVYPELLRKLETYRNKRIVSIYTQLAQQSGIWKKSHHAVIAKQAVNNTHSKITDISIHQKGSGSSIVVFDAKTSSVSNYPSDAFYNSLKKGYSDGSFYEPLDPKSPFEIYSPNTKSSFRKNFVQRMSSIKSFYQSPMTYRERTLSKGAGLYFMVKMSIEASICIRAIYDNEIKKTKGLMTTEEAVDNLTFMALFSGAFYVLSKVSSRLAGHVGLALLVYDVFSFIYNHRKELFSEFYRKKPIYVINQFDYKGLVNAMNDFEAKPDDQKAIALWNKIVTSPYFALPKIRLRLTDEAKKPVFYEAFIRTYSEDLSHYKQVYSVPKDVQNLKEIPFDKLHGPHDKSVVIKVDGHLAYPHKWTNEAVLSIPKLYYNNEVYRPKKIEILYSNGDKQVFKAHYLNAWKGLESNFLKAEMTKIISEKPIVVSPRHQQTPAFDIWFRSNIKKAKKTTLSSLALQIDLKKNTISMVQTSSSNAIFGIMIKDNKLTFIPISDNKKNVDRLSAKSFLEFVSKINNEYFKKQKIITIDAPSLQYQRMKKNYEKNKEQASNIEKRIANMYSKMAQMRQVGIDISKQKEIERDLKSLNKTIESYNKSFEDKNIQNAVHQLISVNKAVPPLSPCQALLKRIKTKNYQMSSHY